MEEKVKLPPRVAFWRDATFHIDPNGPHLSQWIAYGLYTAEQVRQTVLEERERIAAFIEADYERQWIRPWREDLADAIRKG